MWELGIAITAMVIWEVGRRLALLICHWHSNRKAIHRILSFTGEVAFVHSTTSTEDPPVMRESDTDVELALSRFAKKGITKIHERFTFEDPATDLILIGSPRYNGKATQLQQYFDIPFQFVFAGEGDSLSERRLSIITEFGEELIASPDYRGAFRELEVDYGILMIASLERKKRLLWLAGVHGIGTIGVHEYLKCEAAEIAQDLPTTDNTASARLLRITYEPASTRDRDRAKIRSVELLGQSKPVGVRTVRQCKAIALDFGNVLMEFDRDRTYRAVAHHIALDLTEVRQVIDSSNLRKRYECGEITTDEFCREFRALLEVSADELPNSFLAESWGDIFWESTPIRSALTELRGNGITLVLVSNTNDLHFRRVTQDYPDLISLFDARILSYEQEVAKPDRLIFERTLGRIQELCPGVMANEVAYVDDKEGYVKVAEDMGMQGFVYNSYPHFVFWLRQHGLYLA